MHDLFERFSNKITEYLDLALGQSTTMVISMTKSWVFFFFFISSGFCSEISFIKIKEKISSAVQFHRI